MQIHEITRRKINEGILKGVSSNPVNFGRTTVAMPQQTVAPSKVTFAPNMMPKPAPSANLALAPKTTALAKAPSTGVTTTTPTGGVSTAAPRTGSLTAANKARPNQSDPNVIDVDAKDITNRQALSAPATEPTTSAAPAPAAPAADSWTPVNPNVKPGGSKEAQAFRTQQAEPAAQAEPTTPTSNFKTIKGAKAPTLTTPGKAGFARNAAEYFANKTMNMAGIPLSQQGQYHPGGHIAAGLGQGLTAIQKQENDIASKLSNEWTRQQTLNQNSVMLTPNNIKSAAQLINQAGNDLKIDLNNVVKLVMKQANDTFANKQSAQAQQIASYKRALEMYQKSTTQQEKAKALNVIDTLKNQMKTSGLSVEQINDLNSDSMAKAKQAASDPNFVDQPPTPTASTDQMRGAKKGMPNAQDYANLEKRLQQAMAAQGQAT
jgi:hypothetical protein